MEAPFLSLSKKPRFQPIRYSGPNGVTVTVAGGEPHGIANIWDWDLVIWLLSQIRQATDQGLSVSRKVRFSRWAYLKDARRHTGGDEYKRLESTIARLKNTMITTTIRARKSRTVMFNWLEYVEIERDENGNLQNAVVVLPEWLFDAVCDHDLVLTLHRDYFLLTGGIERYLYRILRKSAGATSWKWKLRTLHERSGTTQQYKYFARDLRKIIARKKLLDYSLSLVVQNGEQWLKATRVGKQLPTNEIKPRTSELVHFLRLKSDTYEAARKVAPGFDVYAIESIWRSYCQKKKVAIENPDRAFIGFCRTYAKKNPIPAR